MFKKDFSVMLRKPLLFIALNSFLKAGDGEERAAGDGHFPFAHIYSIFFND